MGIWSNAVARKNVEQVLSGQFDPGELSGHIARGGYFDSVQETKAELLELSRSGTPEERARASAFLRLLRRTDSKFITAITEMLRNPSVEMRTIREHIKNEKDSDLVMRLRISLCECLAAGPNSRPDDVILERIERTIAYLDGVPHGSASGVHGTT